MRFEPAARDIFEHRPTLRTRLGVIRVDPKFIAGSAIPGKVPDNQKILFDLFENKRLISTQIMLAHRHELLVVIS
jgi:hypothetical protein